VSRSQEPGVSKNDGFYYVFVNRAGFQTRHNLDNTGAFVSAGFAAAAPEALPRGMIMAYAPSPGAPQGRAAKQAYIEGSMDYLQFLPNPSYIGFLTPFVSGVINEYRIEYDAELARRRFAPQSPSRLSAIYAFADLASCKLASSNWGWPMSEVEKFRLVPHPLNRVARVNMQIVSLARYAYPRGSWSSQDISQIWRAYWSGDGEIELAVPVDGQSVESRKSGVLWESLIDGVLTRVGTASR
jgi:hypothetical protein